MCFLLLGTSYYERLNDEEEQVEPSSMSQSPRSPTTSEVERSGPVKRSPLTRMKSDSSDMEKRPKFSKTSYVSQQFRPVSMMNMVCMFTSPGRGK